MTTKAKKSKESAPKFDYTTIKTFEDACEKLGIDPDKLPEIPLEEFKKPITAVYKLMIIYKAINDGWIPDWNDSDQWKYYPWFSVLSSGFGLSYAYYSYGRTAASVGSRLCTDTSKKALFIASKFKSLYRDLFLYSE